MAGECGAPLHLQHSTDGVGRGSRRAARHSDAAALRYANRITEERRGDGTAAVASASARVRVPLKATAQGKAVTWRA